MNFLSRILPFYLYKISGHSMEPTIKQGDLVLVSHWAYLFKSPKIGEVIIFRHNNQYWVKRIKEVRGEKLKVEGDNKKDSLEIGLIEKDQVIGKVLRKLN